MLLAPDSSSSLSPAGPYLPLVISSLGLRQHRVPCSLFPWESSPKEHCLQLHSRSDIIAGVSCTCSVLRDREGQKEWKQARGGFLEGCGSGRPGAKA